MRRGGGRAWGDGEGGGGVEYATALTLLEPVEHHVHAHAWQHTAVYEHRVGGSMGRVRREQVQHACAEAGEGRGATGRGGGVEYATALNLLEPVEHHMHARTHGSTRSLRASCRRADEVAGDAERTSAIEGRRIEVTCHVCGEEDAEVGSGRGRGSSDAGHGELRSSLSSKWFTGNM